jgi:hypothetical protein
VAVEWSRDIFFMAFILSLICDRAVVLDILSGMSESAETPSRLIYDLAFSAFVCQACGNRLDTPNPLKGIGFSLS